MGETGDCGHKENNLAGGGLIVGRKISGLKSLVPREGEDQAAVMEWARYDPRLAWLFAIPNGGHRAKLVAVQLRREGVKRGPADLCLPVRRDPWPGLWLELKRSNAAPSALQEPQKAFANHVITEGFAWGCARGADEARALLLDYLESRWDQSAQIARWKLGKHSKQITSGTCNFKKRDINFNCRTQPAQGESCEF